MNRTDTLKTIEWLKAQVTKIEGSLIYPKVKDQVERLRKTIRELEEKVRQDEQDLHDSKETESLPASVWRAQNSKLKANG